MLDFHPITPSPFTKILNQKNISEKSFFEDTSNSVLGYLAF